MAKDDYDVIVFKILLYLYAVLKRKIVFDEKSFYHAIGDVNKSYLVDILIYMQEESLILGLVTMKAWGNENILCSDLMNLKITVQGVHYLEENKKMNKIKEYLLSNIDVVASLITMCLSNV